MKTIILSLLIFTSHAHAKTIVVKPGRSQDISIHDFKDTSNQTLVINCEQELQCRIEHDYVGKYYKLTMPNGKIFKKYKEESLAIEGASSLISAKVCDRLVIDVDKEQPVVSN